MSLGITYFFLLTLKMRVGWSLSKAHPVTEPQLEPKFLDGWFVGFFNSPSLFPSLVTNKPHRPGPPVPNSDLLFSTLVASQPSISVSLLKQSPFPGAVSDSSSTGVLMQSHGSLPDWGLLVLSQDEATGQGKLVASLANNQLGSKCRCQVVLLPQSMRCFWPVARGGTSSPLLLSPHFSSYSSPLASPPPHKSKGPPPNFLIEGNDSC